MRTFEEKSCMNRNLEERTHERHTETVYLHNFPTVSILFGKTSPKSGGMCDNCLLTPMFRSLMIPGRDRFDCIWMWI